MSAVSGGGGSFALKRGLQRVACVGLRGMGARRLREEEGEIV